MGRLGLTYHHHVYSRQLVEPAVNHRELSSVLWDYLDGWDQRGQREVQKGGIYS